jgi:hypothetical protein
LQVVPRPHCLGARDERLKVRVDQIMGESKTSKPAVLATLAKVIRKYQIVAVQEAAGLVTIASFALHKAKQAGGNRVCLAEPSTCP